LGGKIVFKLTPKYTTQDWGLNSADPELCHMWGSCECGDEPSG